jgi:hypothetical protein
MEITMTHATTAPVACTLTGAEQAQHQQDVRDLFRSVDAVRELPDGYAFRFPADDRFLTALADFIAVERRCCPFFTFTLTVEPSGGPLWLHLCGSAEIKAFVEGSFLSLARQHLSAEGVCPC